MSDATARQRAEDPAGSRDALPTAHELGLAAIVHEPVVASTMDVAHALAQSGAPAGTLVVADAQTSGRGRGGRVWTSERLAGVWMTLIERPTDAMGLDVISIRLGLAIASRLDPLVDLARGADDHGEVGRSDAPPVQVKWPNDLYVRGAKLAGVLVETRWRDQSLEWVAIGIGINLHATRDASPARESASRIATLAPKATRDVVMRSVVPAMRAAARASGPLGEAELQEWRSRDIALGRHAVLPARGVVKGISRNGALRVFDPATGTLHELRSGSLVLDDSRGGTIGS